MDVDVVVFGGGAAGLWLTDALHRRNYRVLLLEAGRLGSGQTVASQGIIHGGLKYSLSGLLTGSAAAVREMPARWRDALGGASAPDLRHTRLRSPHCYLWRTDSLASRVGMIGARVGLRVAPQTLSRGERPGLLADCPGTVARLDEQVIDASSFVEDLRRQHAVRILSIDAAHGLQMRTVAPGEIESIELTNPISGQWLRLRPATVVFTAGAGNESLRQLAGLQESVMQKRPLHMVLARGRLPQFAGHCVDGSQTRVTITSDSDTAGRTVWQIGGRIAERGTSMSGPDLIALALSELQAVIPGFDGTELEWSTYRVDRAERRTDGGNRPDSVQVLLEGNCLTAWPTKLALAPTLADDIVKRLPAACAIADPLPDLASWPRPSVAMPPWETVADWYRIGAGGNVEPIERKAA